VLAASQGLITNKRTITTNVVAEDGGIVVLGGLLSDDMTEEKAQVPFLGSIPILGELFKTRAVKRKKTNLMFFIRPRILRDGVDAAIETNAKYNYLRGQQDMMFGNRVPLMPSERQPDLPTLDKLVPSDLLRQTEQLAPQGTTPAQRVEVTSGSINAPPAPAVSPPTVPPPAPSEPFGTPLEPGPTSPPPGTNP
jgi:general secretion pathway protein D